MALLSCLYLFSIHYLFVSNFFSPSVNLYLILLHPYCSLRYLMIYQVYRNYTFFYFKGCLSLYNHCICCNPHGSKLPVFITRSSMSVSGFVFRPKAFPLQLPVDVSCSGMRSAPDDALSNSFPTPGIPAFPHQNSPSSDICQQIRCRFPVHA